MITLDVQGAKGLLRRIEGKIAHVCIHQIFHVNKFDNHKVEVEIIT